MSKKAGPDRRVPPDVRYGPFTELKLYEITEAELDALANGPPGQLDLSVALALLPAALTVLITLQTVDIKDNRTYLVYWASFGLLSIQGAYALARWLVTARTGGELVNRIRSRMPDRPGLMVEDRPPSPSDAVGSP